MADISPHVWREYFRTEYCCVTIINQECYECDINPTGCGAKQTVFREKKSPLKELSDSTITDVLGGTQ